MQRPALPLPMILQVVLLAVWLGGCQPASEEHSCGNLSSPECKQEQVLANSRASSVAAGVIQRASAFAQGDNLYARAELDDLYLSTMMALLRHGEPLLVTYRFRFYRLHDWLPGLRLSQVVLKRRLRLRLITRRYEMLDIKTGRIQYTGSVEDAKEFMGAPSYVLLGKGARQLAVSQRHRLDVDLTIEHEGTLQLFRVLDQWLSFGYINKFSFQSDYNP